MSTGKLWNSLPAEIKTITSGAGFLHVANVDDGQMNSLLPRVIQHSWGKGTLYFRKVSTTLEGPLGGENGTSIWANPFKIVRGDPPGPTLATYKRHVRSNPLLFHQVPLLMGKTFGCWCKPSPCHGDVLVKLVKEYLEREDLEDSPDVDFHESKLRAPEQDGYSVSECSR